MTTDPPQKMTCLKCAHVWIDLPGAWGANFKDGCPKYGSLYWTAGRVDGAP